MTRLIVRLCAALAVLALLRAAGCTDYLRPAPAPFPRTARPVRIDPVGHYHLYWGRSITYQMTLAPGGVYSAVSHSDFSEVWRGTWKLEDGQLHICETRRLDCPPDFCWSVAYPGDRSPRRIERIGSRQR